MPAVRLPDGSSRNFDLPLSVADVAASIGAGLARAALAGRVDGVLVDTSFVIDKDCELAIITDRDADGLAVIRHSCAHLMAQAVQRLFPEAQVTIGPVIDDGFFYDFAYARPFTPEDLQKIEEKMREIVLENLPVHRSLMSRSDAIAMFEGMGEKYKVEIIGSIHGDEDISFYRQGEFIDLCRGPHVPDTGKFKAFKLTSVAGAYWRGDAKNEMLQRVYGTAWGDKKPWINTFSDWKRLRNATIARLVKSWSSSISRRKLQGWCSGIPKAGQFIRLSRPICRVCSVRTAIWKFARRNWLTTVCGSDLVMLTSLPTRCSVSSLKTVFMRSSP